MNSKAKKIVATSKAPDALGAYSQAIMIDMASEPVNGFVYTSGQLGIDPATGVLQEGVEAQAKQAMCNVKAILEEAGSSLDKVVKTTIFISDINDFQAVNGVYESFFAQENYPARSVVAVAALPKNAMLEIEMVALR